MSLSMPKQSSLQHHWAWNSEGFSAPLTGQCEVGVNFADHYPNNTCYIIPQLSDIILQNTLYNALIGLPQYQLEFDP